MTPPRAFLAAAAPLAAALVVAGCSSPRTASTRDDAGRGPRVVVVAPAAAEMIDALGAGDSVVGVGDFVDRPARFRELPKVGAYDAPNVERVLGLDADLLVTTRSEAARDSDTRLRALGVEVLALDTSTFEGVFDALAALGDRLGRRSRAAELAREMHAGLDDVSARVVGAPRRRVLFVVGRDPLYVAGPGSPIDAMISLAGGVNVARDAVAPYQMVSLEAMLQRLPQVIVDTSDNRPDALRGRARGPWGRWAFVPAVRDARVYFVAPDRLVIPGIRLPEMTRLMGRLIHPEVFGEPSPGDFGPAADGREGGP